MPAFPTADLPTLAELDRQYARHVLELCGGNKAKTAETLGISRATLYKMLSEPEIKSVPPAVESSAAVADRVG